MFANGRNHTAKKKLSPRQEAAALVLAQGGTSGDAAAASKVGTSTVKQWSGTLPHFRRAVAAYRAEMTERALGVASAHLTRAMCRIVYIMEHSASERVQLKAASLLIDRQLRLTELVSHEERLVALEAAHQTFTRPRVAS
jgi:hypothetical protein